MAIASPVPAYTDPSRLADAVKNQGYGVLSPSGLAAFLGCPLSELDALRPGWDDLPLDNFLRDGGRYRRRRHSSFIVTDAGVEQVAHRAHYQPPEYNALHGGMLRLFEPVAPAAVARPVWTRLLLALGRVCSAVRAAHPWYVEAHQFRIGTDEGIGRPTPEGAHRDGVDFVAILLAARENVRGGESRIFEAEGPYGQRFTLTEPWTLLLLDDRRVIHESTPIQPAAAGGHRDTLVLTYRAGGFLEPDAQL